MASWVAPSHDPVPADPARVGPVVGVGIPGTTMREQPCEEWSTPTANDIKITATED